MDDHDEVAESGKTFVGSQPPLVLSLPLVLLVSTARRCRRRKHLPKPRGDTACSPALHTRCPTHCSSTSMIIRSSVGEIALSSKVYVLICSRDDQPSPSISMLVSTQAGCARFHRPADAVETHAVRKTMTPIDAADGREFSKLAVQVHDDARMTPSRRQGTVELSSRRSRPARSHQSRARAPAGNTPSPGQERWWWRRTGSDWMRSV